jgi:hypothetical protein
MNTGTSESMHAATKSRLRQVRAVAEHRQRAGTMGLVENQAGGVAVVAWQTPLTRSR